MFEALPAPREWFYLSTLLSLMNYFFYPWFLPISCVLFLLSYRAGLDFFYFCSIDFLSMTSVYGSSLCAMRTLLFLQFGG